MKQRQIKNAQLLTLAPPVHEYLIHKPKKKLVLRKFINQI